MKKKTFFAFCITISIITASSIIGFSINGGEEEPSQPKIHLPTACDSIIKPESNKEKEILVMPGINNENEKPIID